jgi:uncharacterized protein
MSTLRQRLKHPGTYLSLLGLLAALVSVDSFRGPEHQVASHQYISLVRVYQRVGRPLLDSHVQCRYQPTCSRYSIQAVGRYGLMRGLALTFGRLWRCRGSVPLGTADPLP